MNQDPLNVLWVEPHFLGRLGAVADWLVRRRGYRSWSYCHPAGAMDLLELEQCDLVWTPTHWQRRLFPAEYRDDLWVQHDGVDAPHSVQSTRNGNHNKRRSIAGRTVPAGTRVVTFVARSLER